MHGLQRIPDPVIWWKTKTSSSRWKTLKAVGSGGCASIASTIIILPELRPNLSTTSLAKAVGDR